MPDSGVLDLSELKPIELSDLKPVSGSMDLSELKPIDLSDLKPVSSEPSDATIKAGPEPGFFERLKALVVGSPRSGDTPIGRALGYSFEAPTERHVPTTELPLARTSEMAPEVTKAMGLAPGMDIAMGTKVGQGVGKGVAGAAEAMTTAPNVLMMAGSEGFGLLAQVNKFLPRAISAGFSIDMLHQAYDQAPAVKKAWDSGDAKATAEALTHVVATAGLGAMAGVHAVHGVQGDISQSIDTHNAEAQRLFEQEKAQPTGNPEPAEFTLGGQPIPVKIGDRALEIRPAGMSGNRRPFYDVVDTATGDVIKGGYGRDVQDFLRMQGAEPNAPVQQTPGQATASESVAAQAPIQSPASVEQPAAQEGYELPTGTVMVTGRENGKTLWTKDGVPQEPRIDSAFNRMVQGAAPVQEKSVAGQIQPISLDELKPAQAVDLSDLKPAQAAETAPSEAEREVIQPKQPAAVPEGARADLSKFSDSQLAQGRDITTQSYETEAHQDATEELQKRHPDVNFRRVVWQGDGYYIRAGAPGEQEGGPYPKESAAIQALLDEKKGKPTGRVIEAKAEESNAQPQPPLPVRVGSSGSEVLPLPEGVDVGVPGPAGTEEPRVPGLQQANGDQAGIAKGAEKAEAVAQKLGIRRRTGLPEKEQSAADKTRLQLAKDPDGFVAEYRKQFGNVFAADDAAELFDAYGKSEESRAGLHQAIHESSRWLRDAAFDQALADPKSPKRVIFTSGGSASGKSTVVPQLLKEGDSLVYDSTLSDLRGAQESIEKVLSAGKRVVIAHVRRDIEDSFRANLERAQSGSGRGRTTNITAMVRSHRGADEVISELAERYANNPKVSIIAFDNKAGGPVQVNPSNLQKRDYTGVDARLFAALERERANLPAHIYRAGLGAYKPSGNRGSEEVRGQAGSVTERLPAGGPSNQSRVHPPREVAPARKLSSTQVNLPEEFVSKAREAAAKIPDRSLAEDGREDNPHITALYGLHDSEPAAVQKVLEGEGPVTARVKTTSIFPATKDHPYDVVKLDVDSPQLAALNKKLRALPNSNEFPDFRPHITLATVKAGEGKKYAGRVVPGLSGKEITFDALTFSPAEGEKTHIPLKAEKSVAGQTTPAQAFRMKAQQLQELAKAGDKGAQVEIDRRAAKNGKTPAKVEMIGAPEYLHTFPGEANTESVVYITRNHRYAAALRDKDADKIVNGSITIYPQEIQAVNKAQDLVGRYTNVAPEDLGKAETKAPKEDTKAAEPETAAPKEVESETGEPHAIELSELKPVRPSSAEPLAEQLFQGSGSPGEERTATAGSRKSGAARKPRARAGTKQGPELESGGGTVSGVVGNPAEPERTFPPRAQDVVSTRHDRDYKIPDGRVVSGSPEARARINIDAIKTLREIQQENRLATVEEQDILAKYVGWGAVPQLFSGKNAEFQALQDELKNLLSDEEYSDAQRSTTNAHYTGDLVVDSIWKAVQSLGAKPGMSWLEPAVGVGNFFGRQPQEMLEGARRVGLDKDSLSAQIAKLLYPDSGIEAAAFEDAELPKDYFDGVISNVPFGNFGVHDAEFKGKKFITGSIHNYFFAKALTHVRPGGVVAFVTSRYTMDAYSPDAVQLRSYLRDQAHFVGAVRLPSGSFRQNAGTDVITDIIFLRKKLPGEEKQLGHSWVKSDTKNIAREGWGNYPINVNEYYHKNPENILGTESLSRGQFTNHDYDVAGNATAEQIAAAVENFPKIGFADWTPGKKSRAVAVRELNAPAEQSKLGGLFFDDKGNLFRKTSKGSAEPIETTDGGKARIRGQLAIRDALVRLTDAELSGKPDMQLDHLRKILNHAYDIYVKSNGPLSSQSNTAAMKGDPDAPLLVSLERRFDKGNKAQGKNPFAEKAPIFERRMLKPPEVPTSVGDPKEALYIALNEKGRLDFDRMSELTGRTPEQLQQDLAGLVYEDPTTKTWQTAEEYLSGSVRAKLKQAKAIAKVEPKYKANVEALEKAQPTDVPPGEIRALLGVTWVPIDRYSEFAAEMLGADRPDQVKVKYAGGNWIVDTGWGNRLNNSPKWSTARVGGAELLADSLNMRRTKVYDRSPDGDSINPQETQAARARQMEMQDHFEKWLFADTKRGDELVRIYNDTQNDLRLRTYEGGHLTLPGMTKDAAVVRGGDLEPHQKAAVWRVIVQPNVLLAHAVGTGKTFEAIAGGMELQRLGLIRRPMYVVPNATLTSWQNQFAALYPQKRVLVFSEKDLDRSKRQQLMAQIATGDWDAVVVPHSSFQFLPTGDAIFEEHFEKLSRELEQAIQEATEAGLATQQIKRMEKSKERLLTSLKDKRKAESKDLTVTWEQLGIDHLFVDESHEYKKLGFATKQGNVAGIDQQGNQKTFDLLMKMRHTQKHGRGVVFMTGTPVTNTMGELFSIMKYLIEPEMEARGIGKFDEWGANFGRTVDVFEPKIEGGGYQMKARFSKFVNLPELAQLFRSFADVVTSDMVDLPRPEIIGGKRIAVESQLNDEQSDVLDELRQRAKSIRQDPRKALPDNMLSVYTDAQKMALDVRMVRPGAEDDPNGRLNEAADLIHKFWEESVKEKGTQAVFSDLGKPAEAGGSKDFSVYDELIRKLVERGIPRNEIAHIYQAKNKAQRSRLFQDVSDGKIRVLIGSTMKMGVGVNIQQKLYALHHLDVPHRPSDLEQREGRILRQGNANPEVHIRYYVTKGSLDEAKFANVVRKAKFINQVMQGKSEVREAEDVGGMVPSLEMFQAMASGDPRVMRKMEVDAEVDRLGGVFSGWKNQQYKIRTELQQIPGRIQWAKKAIENIQRDMSVRDKSGEKWVFGKQVLSGEKISKDVTAAIRKQLPKIIDGKSRDVEIGTAYGLPLLVSAEYGDKGVIKIEIGDTAAINPTVEEAINGDLYRRIKNQIEDLEHAVSSKEQVIDRAQKEEKNLKNSIEENWPYAKQYQDMVAEQQKLVKDLGADKGDDAATAVGEGGEVTDKRVQAQETEDTEEEESENGPEQDALYMRGAAPEATGPIRTAFRNKILWVNSAGMKKLGEVFGAEAVNGMYIPSGKAAGLLGKVAPELRPGITAALRAGPTIAVVRMDPGQSISQSKAKARHELFHATEEWGGEGRAKDLLEHPLARRASALLAGGGYDAKNPALMFSEIGAHLASGPAGWEAMGLDENEASELFGRYLDLLDEETLFKLNRVAPQLKRELYAERSIRREQTELGPAGGGQNDRAEEGQDEGTGGVQEGVPKDVQPRQGTRPQGTGKVKESKLAQGVEEKAIANGLTEGFEGRPEYQTVNIADQAKRAAELLKSDPDRAIEIAMGRGVPPNGLLPESVFVAVENFATANKDVNLLRELATSSSLSLEATGMGQRIRMLGERNPDSAVAAMQKVADAREAVAKKRYGPKAKETAKAQIKVAMKLASTAPKKKWDAEAWAKFAESIKCPE